MAMATWRVMAVDDIDALMRIADEVHPDLPESDYVFKERVQLFPEGCLALVEDDKLCGYAISHPIRQHQLPALDSMLGEIPSNADQYYIHDLAILPKLRGRGLAASGLQKLFVVARSYPTTCLVSVYDTAPFWGRFGFVHKAVNLALLEKLRGYGEDAAFLERQNGTKLT